MRVTRTSFNVHHKRGDSLAPPTLRCDYPCGLSGYSEYVSFEGNYYARQFAVSWWHSHGGRAPDFANCQ
jgi:DNA repair protein RadD